MITRINSDEIMKDAILGLFPSMRLSLLYSGAMETARMMPHMTGPKKGSKMVMHHAMMIPTMNSRMATSNVIFTDLLNVPDGSDIGFE